MIVEMMAFGREEEGKADVVRRAWQADKPLMFSEEFSDGLPYRPYDIDVWLKFRGYPPKMNDPNRAGTLVDIPDEDYTMMVLKYGAG